MKFAKKNNIDYQFNLILPAVTLLTCFIMGLNFLIAGILTLTSIFIGLGIDLIILNKNEQKSSKIAEIQVLARKIMKQYEEESFENKTEIDSNQLYRNDENDKTLKTIAKEESYFSESEPLYITDKLEIQKIADKENSVDNIAELAENALSDVVKIENKVNKKDNADIVDKEIELINEISSINSEFSTVVSEIWQKTDNNTLENTENHSKQVSINPQVSFREEIKKLKEKIADKVKSVNYNNSENPDISKKEIYENIDKKEEIITKTNEEVVVS